MLIQIHTHAYADCVNASAWSDTTDRLLLQHASMCLLFGLICIRLSCMCSFQFCFSFYSQNHQRICLTFVQLTRLKFLAVIVMALTLVVFYDTTAYFTQFPSEKFLWSLLSHSCLLFVQKLSYFSSSKKSESQLKRSNDPEIERKKNCRRRLCLLIFT